MSAAEPIRAPAKERGSSMKLHESEAARWRAQSEDDRRFAACVRKENLFYDKGCFISPQADEKAMKACLDAMGRRHVSGHSIDELSEGLGAADTRFAALLDPAKQLDCFYISTRHPNGLPRKNPFQVFDRGGLENALRDLDRVMAVRRRLLTEKGILRAGAPPDPEV